MPEPRLPSEHVATPHAPCGPEFRPGRAAGALTLFASLVLTGSAFGQEGEGAGEAGPCRFDRPDGGAGTWLRRRLPQRAPEP